MCHNRKVDLSVAETLNSKNLKNINPKTYKLLNINTKKRPLGCRKRPTLSLEWFFLVLVYKSINFRKKTNKDCIFNKKINTFLVFSVVYTI